MMLKILRLAVFCFMFATFKETKCAKLDEPDPVAADPAIMAAFSNAIRLAMAAQNQGESVSYARSAMHEYQNKLIAKVHDTSNEQTKLREAGEVCTAELAKDLPYCAILVGINVTSLVAAQTVDFSAQLSFKSMALTREVSSTSDCKIKFSNFLCVQGMVGCTDSKQVPLLPCFQRCVDFQISCLQMSSTEAAAACSKSVNISNTARNANCFCGDRDPATQSPYEVCDGPCHPLSECAPEQQNFEPICVPQTTANARFCAILNRTNVTTALAAQAADAAAAINFASQAARDEISESDLCRRSFSNFMCVQGVTGCFGAKPTPLMPCAHRCTDYHTVCRGLPFTDALAACQLTAGISNTLTNADCFCGLSTGGSPGRSELCSGVCDERTECGRGEGGLCTAVQRKGFAVCRVLEGLFLSSQTADVTAIDARISGAFNRSALAGEVLNTAECRAKHAALACPQAVYGCEDGRQSTMRPCLWRCIDFHQSCLGASEEQAAAACARTAGTNNTPDNVDCFCGVEASVVGESGVCDGKCSPRSPCGQSVQCDPVPVSGLPFCRILNGVSVRVGYNPRTLDAAAQRQYNLRATGGAVLVAKTDECRARFADFTCSQGVIGCSAAGRQQSLLPCLQRCLDFLTSCQAMSAARAAVECARSAGVNNTADNSDCFCGDPARADVSPYDFCVGPCHPLSQCGRAVTCSPAVASGMSYCTVLNGMNVTSLAEAQAADAAASAAFALLVASGKVSNSAACRASHAAFVCSQGITGCSSGAVAAAAGLPAIRTSLLPCLQRCLDYQTTCLGAPTQAAAAACDLTTGIYTTPGNANCFCGAGGGTIDSDLSAAALSVAGTRDVCVGKCSSFSACGRSIACTPVRVTGLRFCTMLNGVTVANLSAALFADEAALADFGVKAAAGAVANTAACRQQFAHFRCWRDVAGCSATVGGGVETTLMPCLQRCLDYKAACFGMGLSEAAASCAASAWLENTANNSDCFCGAGAEIEAAVKPLALGEIAAPLGFCVGNCAAAAGCGAGFGIAAGARALPDWLAIAAAGVVAAALPTASAALTA